MPSKKGNKKKYDHSLKENQNMQVAANINQKFIWKDV